MLGGTVGAHAQEQRAALEGIVRDSQGGAMPGVAVVARNAAGLSINGVTDGSGHYRFAALPPGRYEVSARPRSFMAIRMDGVSVGW